MTGTLPRVARPRGTLTDEQLRRLTKAGKKRGDANAAYRAEVVAVLLEGGSFNEVRDATGLSKDTLQRWKREEIGEHQALNNCAGNTHPGPLSTCRVPGCGPDNANRDDGSHGPVTTTS